MFAGTVPFPPRVLTSVPSQQTPLTKITRVHLCSLQPEVQTGNNYWRMLEQLPVFDFHNMESYQTTLHPVLKGMFWSPLLQNNICQMDP